MIIKPQTPIINWGNPLTKGLVFDVPMHEGSGQRLFDLSTFKLNTGFTNLVNSDWKKDYFGTSLNFPGSNQYTNWGSPTHLTSLSRGFSIVALVKPSSVTGNHGIASNGSGSWYLRLNGANADFLCSNIAGVVTGTRTLAVDTWYQIAITVSYTATATFNLYVNGLLDATASDTRTFNTGKFVSIGSDVNGASNPTEYFAGRMGFVRAYNTLLSSQDIKNSYDNPFQIYQQPDINKYVIMGAAAPASAIKTINGLVKASVKSVNNLAIANVKSWNGLA